MNRSIYKYRPLLATLLLLTAAGAACSREVIPYETVKVEGVDDIRVLLDARQYAEAESLARETLARVEEAQGPGSLEASIVVDLLVETLMSGHGGPDEFEIRELAERAVKIKQRILGDDHLGVAESVAKLGVLNLLYGRVAEAKEPLQRALTIRIHHLGQMDLLVAESQDDLATAYADLGDYAAAEPLYLQALETTQDISGEDHADVAPRLYNLARMYRRMGDYDAARPLFQDALDVIKKALGYKHPWYSMGLNGYAILLEETGDYSGAREQYERALDIARDVHGAEHLVIADCLNNLGLLYRSIGDYEQARSLYEQALTMTRKTQGAKHPYAASTQRNLGELHYLMGEYEEARVLYEEVLDLRRELPSDSYVIADSLLDLGNLLLEEKQFAKAEPYFKEALEILDTDVGRGHQDYARVLTGLGHVNDRRGNLEAARVRFQEAVAIRKETLGPDHPDTAASLLDVGRVLAKTGDVESALDRVLRAETIARDHLRLTAHSLAEREALRYSAVRTSGLHLALSLAAQGLEAPSRRRVWDAVIRSRTLVLDEMAARHKAFAGDAEPARLSDEFEAASRRLANLVVHGPNPDRPDHYRVLVDEARRAREVAERALAQQSIAFRRERATRSTGLADVSEGLPPGSALIAFVQYEQVDIANAMPGEPTGSYLAFVLTEGDDPAVIALGSNREIDGLVSRWRDEVAPGAAARSDLVAGEMLRRRIWDPLAPLLEDAERVFVVPDGALHLLNLNTLPTGEKAFLIERGPLIHYLSAERDLVLSGVERSRGSGLLAMGGVSFDEESVPTTPSGVFRGKHSGCPDFRSVRFKPLPASARESMEVAEIWRKASVQEKSSGANQDQVVHLTAAEASEAAFKESAPGKRVLHLATHGFFIGGECRSGLEASRGIGGLVPARGENPLLLSGLAFAGANHRDAASPDEEDGILTAQEIAAMDLSGVEWAVLSACDTGLGELRAGEGVFGLRRALQVAGVRTLIMSLGSVEDETARKWMRIFYEGRLLRGMGTIEAVQEASLELLRGRRARGETDHPAYWSPFVAVGQWK